MFRFRKKAAPKLLSSNPGIGVAGKVGFANAVKSWSEHYDLPPLLASVLREREHVAQSEKSWLVLQGSGFILTPQLVYLQPLDEGDVRTTTTIQTNHPTLVPDGVYEYQHSTGNSVEDSVRKGFDLWVQTDLVALLDALQPNPKTCTTLQMTFPEKDGKPGNFRRAILGPVTQFVQDQRIYVVQHEMSGSPGGVHEERCENHEFCPCCLLTNSFEAFKELIESTRFYGLRLFAARDGNGVPQADCRVNGKDWEKGAEALRRYVTTWPGTGYEFRNQYVVLHSVEKES